jgi:hypothetical protein
MHLAKFAPKLTLFPTNPSASHAGGERGKSTRARTDLGSQNYRRSEKNHKQNQSQKRTPFAPARPESSEPETPETAKKSARLPSPPRQRPSISRIARATEDGAAESNARRPPGSTERRTARARRGLPDRVGAGSASASAPESLSPLPPTPARGGRIEEEEEREREGGWWRKAGNGDGGRRDATRRRIEKEDTLITHKKIAGQQ